MNDLLNSMEEDVKEDIVFINNDKLKAISLLAEEQLELEKSINEGEKLLKDLKLTLRSIQEKELPEAMLNNGMKEFKLKSGASITIKSGYAASITKKNEGQAFGWLKNNNHDSIIKNEVKVSFGKGEESTKDVLMNELNKEDYTKAVINTKQFVHPQTLRAFVNEQIENGVNIPHDLFGVFAWQKSIVKGE